LEERFAALTEAELSARAPHQFPVADESVLGMIALMVQHDSYHVGQLALLSYHVGQLALLRKHYGLAAMRYA
jgi:hypothetical protein